MSAATQRLRMLATSQDAQRDAAAHATRGLKGSPGRPGLTCRKCQTRPRPRFAELQPDGTLVHVALLPTTGQPCGGLIDQVEDTQCPKCHKHVDELVGRGRGKPKWCASCAEPAARPKVPAKPRPAPAAAMEPTAGADRSEGLQRVRVNGLDVHVPPGARIQLSLGGELHIEFRGA